MTSITPEWLRQPQLGLCPCGCIGKRRRGGALQRTLADGARVLRDVMVGDDAARRPGVLQRLDPRVKVLSLLGLLIVVSLVRRTLVLVALYVAVLGVAALSGVSLRTFLTRVWLFVPVFTGVVVLPATLNLVTRGQVVVPLGHWWFGHRVGLTSQGLAAAALIVTRVAVSVSLVVLATLTTPWPRLLSALRAVLVPRLFVQVLGMAYRYVAHLLSAVDDMYTARKSRMVGNAEGLQEGRRFVASTAGALFGKAHALSDEVHMAMLSRGYTGEATTLDRFVLSARDLLWLGACIIAGATALGVDRALAR